MALRRRRVVLYRERGWILVACLLVLGTVHGKRRLLEETIAVAVGRFSLDDEADEETTTTSLGRMLTAFKALGDLKDKSALSEHKEWRASLLDNAKFDPPGIRNFSAAAFNNASLSEIDGVADAAASAAKSKEDLIATVHDVATGDLTFEEAASQQLGTLTKYLNAFIERETRLLDAYSQGHPDDQLSYLLKTSQTNGYVNKVLEPFGVLDSTSLNKLTASLQKRFCSPMAFLPRRSIGKRTVINGPAFEITFSTGVCNTRLGFDQDHLPNSTTPKHAIQCEGREISHTKIPISIHQQDALPEAFTSSQCRIERTFGTPYEKVLHGGGPLVRFASLDAFIDAIVTKKDDIFGGLDDLIVRNITASTWDDLQIDSLEDIADFWEAFGPGRLLREKNSFGSKLLKDLSLPSLLDVAQTSPFGLGLKDEKISPLSNVNIHDEDFSLSKAHILSKIKDGVSKN